MSKIHKGDEVVVTTGKDKGRRGKIAQVLATGKVVVEGVNIAKKHQRGDPNAGVAGGIVEKEMPIDVSNVAIRSEEHTSELQSLMRISYAVFCLKKKKTTHNIHSSKTSTSTIN